MQGRQLRTDSIRCSRSPQAWAAGPRTGRRRPSLRVSTPSRRAEARRRAASTPGRRALHEYRQLRLRDLDRSHAAAQAALLAGTIAHALTLHTVLRRGSADRSDSYRSRDERPDPDGLLEWYAMIPATSGSEPSTVLTPTLPERMFCSVVMGRGVTRDRVGILDDRRRGGSTHFPSYTGSWTPLSARTGMSGENQAGVLREARRLEPGLVPRSRAAGTSMSCTAGPRIRHAAFRPPDRRKKRPVAGYFRRSRAGMLW